MKKNEVFHVYALNKILSWTKLSRSIHTHVLINCIIWMINLKWIISMTIIKLKNANVVTIIWKNLGMNDSNRAYKKRHYKSHINLNKWWGKFFFPSFYIVLSTGKVKNVFSAFEILFLQKKNFEKKNSYSFLYILRNFLFFYQNSIIYIYNIYII